MSRRRVSRKKREPFKDERDALELMARFLVSGGYRVPVAGTGTKPGLLCTDIAGAVGYMRDPLAREVALAVAMRADRRMVAAVSGRAYRRLCSAVRHMRPPVLSLRLAADRWRMRMIVHDAMTELVDPEARRPYRELAKDTKMRASNYTRVHQTVTAELQQLMNEARAEFQLRLFGRLAP